MNISVQQNVSMKEYTTFRVGGAARYFAEAKNWESFFGLREFAKKQGVPFMVLGGGSNVLFADDGYPGLVILNRMEKVIIQGNTVTAESAVIMAKLVLLAAQHNLGGISGLASVPGSIGGGVYGNAGVPECYIKDVFLNATILPTNGNKPLIVGPDYAGFGYRDSNFKKTKDIILSASFKLKRVPAPLIQKEVALHAKARALKQPAGLTCGSFFKNPAHFPSAGWLIDQSGCKGMKEGGAVISEKHANWILNTGKATTSDIINLALKVHRIVKEKHNVTLEPEVQIIPDNPFNKSK